MLHKSPLHQPGDGDNDAKIKGNPIENKRVSASQHSETTKICGHQRTEQGQVLLATALVNVQSSNKTALVLRSLLDQGSQASFITESAVQRLRLKKIPHKGIVSGIGGDKSTLVSKAMVIIEVQSRRDSTVVMTVNAYVLRNLTGFLPESNIVLKMPAPLPTTELADPSFNVASKIDLLLGAEVYGQILLKGVIRGPPGTPIAQNTKLGWILSGHITSQVSCSRNGHSLAMHAQCSNENDLLKKFWELEASPESNIRLTADEQRCEEIFSRTIKRDKNGRFEVKLPFKTSNPKCRHGNSRDIARRQFLSLEKRLARDPELLKEYSSVIKEYLSLGHMEEVLGVDRNKQDAVYLPHHAVIRKDKSTTKVRVVFNASCPGNNGVSLNDELLTGPTLQPELRNIIMRWRCHSVCLVADIIKMYRQVKIANCDVDYQRMFWRENPDEEIRHYRLLRVTFGTAAAPYLAVKSLQQLAIEDGNEYPLAAERVKTDFYMDDLMTGCNSTAEAVELHKQMNNLLSRGGFQLQKWSSNSSDVLEQLKENIFDSSNVLEIKTDEVFKILGLTWNRKTDEFEYTVQ